MEREKQRLKTGKKFSILETQPSWPKKGSHHSQTIKSKGGLETREEAGEGGGGRGGGRSWDVGVGRSDEWVRDGGRDLEVSFCFSLYTYLYQVFNLTLVFSLYT